MSYASPRIATSPAARGALAAGTCYLAWGLVPLYWRQLAGLPPVELIAHRHLWSLVLVLGFTFAQGEFRQVLATLRRPASAGRALLAAALLTGNWLVYVWGVNTGRVVETSLGYFLVPLVNVAVGRFVLQEKLRRIQWLAVGLAGLGVLLLCLRVDHAPWIALVLAGTWGAYSLMRKRSPLGAVTGLAAETLVLAPVVVAYLAWLHLTGTGALFRVDARLHVLLLSSGLITALPLLLFGYGARLIRLSTLGLLQYLAPTVQFALGIWYFHEALSRERAFAFGFIWSGLALYTADNLLDQRRQRLAR